MTTTEPAKVPEMLSALRQREVQMLGAALSLRSWHDTETAYNQLRDKIDAELNRQNRLNTRPAQPADELERTVHYEAGWDAIREALEIANPDIAIRLDGRARQRLYDLFVPKALSRTDVNAELVDALRKLEAAATEVQRYGAQTGPQWPKLTSALIVARNALAKVAK